MCVGLFASDVFDLLQLLVSVVGAAAYAAFSPRGAGSKRGGLSGETRADRWCVRERLQRWTAPRAKPASCVRKGRQAQPEVRQDSRVPVVPATFICEGFDSQVDELLPGILPTPESDRIAEDLALKVKGTICSICPEAEVVGVATGNVMRASAYGVAVPEIDVVASTCPRELCETARNRLVKRSDPQLMSARGLAKSAIRAATDALIATGGYKFRRSAFRGLVPKVTLAASPCNGFSEKLIPFDFSVNNTQPLYNAALITECGRIEPRAKALILFVRRWAKDRGVCHAPKGHLPPYGWTLLTIYFLQVGVKEGPMLPPLEGFKIASGLAQPVRIGAAKEGQDERAFVPSSSKMRVGELFREFIKFYSEFDWRREAASVRLGERLAAGLQLRFHIISHDDGSTEVGPTIEDPLDIRSNVSACLTSATVARMREEMLRVRSLLARGASLTELLDPWMPAAVGDEGDKARAHSASFTTDDCEAESSDDRESRRLSPSPPPASPTPEPLAPRRPAAPPVVERPAERPWRNKKPQS